MQTFDFSENIQYNRNQKKEIKTGIFALMQRAENAKFHEIKSLTQEDKMTLKELREATGLTAQEAAKVLGFPVKTWESWEEGEKSPAPFIEKAIIDKLNKMKRD